MHSMCIQKNHTCTIRKGCRFHWGAIVSIGGTYKRACYACAGYAMGEGAKLIYKKDIFTDYRHPKHIWAKVAD